MTWNSIYYGTMHQLQVNYLDHHRLGDGVLEAARQERGWPEGIPSTILWRWYSGVGLLKRALQLPQLPHCTPTVGHTSNPRLL